MVSAGEWMALGFMLSLYGVVAFLLWRNPDTRAAFGVRALDARLRKWLITRHRPENIGEPTAPELWCFACRKPWPCAELERLVAEEKVAARD